MAHRGTGIAAQVTLWAAAAALGLACPPRPVPETRVPDGGAHPSGRPGVRVPLPEGWSATVTSEGGLRAGPPGRLLMRIDREPGAAAELPTPEVLKSAFSAGLRSFSVKSEVVTRGDGFVGLKLGLSRSQSDGGVQERVIALAAKRAGPDLYLCSTLPTVSPPELEAVLRSCSDIGTAAVEDPP